MGLVKCPDCGKMFSDRIEACVHCGCPIEVALQESLQEESHDAVKTAEDVIPVDTPNEDDETEETENGNLTYDKADLMSYEELKKFAIESVAPYIVKELDLLPGSIFIAPKEHTADIYVKQGNQITGILFRVSVAPNRRQFLNYEYGKNGFVYENEFTLEMNEKGYKCAYADVSIGACDSLKFDRRVLLKKDGYYFDYKKLNYPEVKANGTEIHIDYSTYPEEELSKAVYNEHTPGQNNRNSLKVQKPKEMAGESQRGQYTIDFSDERWAKYEKDGNETNKYENEKVVEIEPSLLVEFQSLIDIYNIQNLNDEGLKDYLAVLYTAIDKKVDEKNLVLTFFNCIDYCNGLFLSDSSIVPPEKIITTCIDLISSNTMYIVSRHKEFVIAHYIYNYIVNGCAAEVVTVEDMHKRRISLFEYSPKLFGFMGLTGEKEKLEKEKDKVAKRKDVMEVKAPRFKELFKRYDSICENGDDNAHEYKAMVVELRDMGEEIKTYFFKYFMRDEEVEAVLTAMFSLIFVLDKEIEILQKTQSGKYGFFEKRKDQKEKSDKVNNYKNCIRKCNF